MRQIKSFVRFRTPARRGNALMRSLYRFLLAAIVGTVLAGCMTTSHFMQAKSQTARNDVFSEADEKGAIPNGYADLEISASIKTHVEGFYPLESKDSLHGKKGYPFVLNVDGQAVVWKVDGREETIPPYFERGGRNPEGGTGIRYVVRKKIRLAAGSHRLYFGLPAEDYYREFNVMLTACGTYALTFEPVYKQRIPGLQRIPNIRNFTNGFDRYEKVWTKIRPDPA
jgi:hypothetical protein